LNTLTFKIRTQIPSSINDLLPYTYWRHYNACGLIGTGKTTFFAACRRLLLPKPQAGSVFKGIDTAQLHDEEERQRYVSYIFQNMEFDTEESIRTLMDVVQNKGFRQTKDEGLIELLIQELELESVLDRKTQEISKGEIQRIILAFSLLYGSRIIMMDEPIFALEESQKTASNGFYYQVMSNREERSLYYAVHDLNISQTYSETAAFLLRRVQFTMACRQIS
jgi:ABC-type Mn2+/Zn2+ transport system ATPase subunit